MSLIRLGVPDGTTQTATVTNSTFELHVPGDPTPGTLRWLDYHGRTTRIIRGR